MQLLTSTLLVVCLAGLAAGQTPAPPRARSATVLMAANSSYLGVAVVEINEDRAKELKLKETRGVEVKVVDEDSPASKAGIKEGDVILEYNGQRVEGTSQFVRMVSETPAGRKGAITVWRNGANHTYTAVIGSRPRTLALLGNVVPTIPDAPVAPVMPDLPRSVMSWHSPMIGIETESLNPQLAEYFGVKDGVLIRFVSKKSLAERGGLKAGDVVTKADGSMVHSAGQISAVLFENRSRKSVPFTVVRNHKELVLDIPLDSDSLKP